MKTEVYVEDMHYQLVVLENDQVRVFDLSKHDVWQIGRYDPVTDVAPDISFISRNVSRCHGVLKKTANTWYYEDLFQNRNGTFYNGMKIPKSASGKSTTLPLIRGDVLRIDSEDLNYSSPKGVLMLFTAASETDNWAAKKLRKAGISIGRSSSNDIVESRAYISAKHCKINYHKGHYYLSDCNSLAGTFLNGQRISKRVPLREKDCISLCDKNYIFTGNNLLYSVNQPIHGMHSMDRPVAVKADIRTKHVKDHGGKGTKEIIRDIHLQIRQGTLVALLGTAGAGKSTVMNCLNGMDLEGVEGSVIYRDVDLMQNFEQMKHMIGSVPQDKTFHPDFTPEKEFRIAALKRLPADTTLSEIDDRVDETLNLLGISGVRQNKNIRLSGGEKTRVNIGIELVADRDFLCLDEPDQGLDPKYKHEVFQIMQDLAHKHGKSVLSIIHDVSEIDMFDQVIMLVKVDGVGRLAFSGSPAEMRKRFGVDDIRRIYGILEKEPQKYVM